MSHSISKSSFSVRLQLTSLLPGHLCRPLVITVPPTCPLLSPPSVYPESSSGWPCLCTHLQLPLLEPYQHPVWGAPPIAPLVSLCCAFHFGWQIPLPWIINLHKTPGGFVTRKHTAMCLLCVKWGADTAQTGPQQTVKRTCDWQAFLGTEELISKPVLQARLTVPISWLLKPNHNSGEKVWLNHDQKMHTRGNVARPGQPVL